MWEEKERGGKKRSPGYLTVTVLSAKGLKDVRHFGGLMATHVEVGLNGEQAKATKGVTCGGGSPKWNEKFSFKLEGWTEAMRPPPWLVEAGDQSGKFLIEVIHSGPFTKRRLVGRRLINEEDAVELAQKGFTYHSFGLHCPSGEDVDGYVNLRLDLIPVEGGLDMAGVKVSGEVQHSPLKTAQQKEDKMIVGHYSGGEEGDKKGRGKSSFQKTLKKQSSSKEMTTGTPDSGVVTEGGGRRISGNGNVGGQEGGVAQRIQPLKRNSSSFNGGSQNGGLGAGGALGGGGGGGGSRKHAKYRVSHHPTITKQVHPDMDFGKAIVADDASQLGERDANSNNESFSSKLPENIDFGWPMRKLPIDKSTLRVVRKKSVTETGEGEAEYDPTTYYVDPPVDGYRVPPLYTCRHTYSAPLMDSSGNYLNSSYYEARQDSNGGVIDASERGRRMMAMVDSAGGKGGRYFDDVESNDFPEMESDGKRQQGIIEGNGQGNPLGYDCVITDVDDAAEGEGGVWWMEDDPQPHSFNGFPSIGRSVGRRYSNAEAENDSVWMSRSGPLVPDKTAAFSGMISDGRRSRSHKEAVMDDGGRKRHGHGVPFGSKITSVASSFLRMWRPIPKSGLITIAKTGPITIAKTGPISAR